MSLAHRGASSVRRRLAMSGVSRDAPLGIQALQAAAGWCCPRLQINRLRCYQGLVLALTYITYMTYHLTRKPISVVKAELHRNCSALPRPPDLPPGDEQWCNWPPFNTEDANTLLGALDSAFLFSYAGAMFVSGMVAERVDLRYFLTLGMLLSSIFCYLFGLAKTYNIHHIAYYILVQAGAGVCQTTGWPGTVAAVGKWFGNTKKGLIFGIWNSHTSLGNILGTLMAARHVEDDWSLSFTYPALVMAGAAMLVFLLLPAEPRHVGLALTPAGASTHKSEEEVDDGDEPRTQVLVGEQSASLRPGRHSANAQYEGGGADESTSLLGGGRRASPAAAGGGAVSLARALRIPGVLEFSLSLFFSKLVSYTFLYWLPLYIHKSTRLAPAASGDLSTAFDAGGIAGAVLAGLLADRSAAPACVCVAFYALAAPMLVVYEWYGAASYAGSVLLLAATGALVNAPYALITTAVSAELGTHPSLAGSGGARALATVTAIIDGTGSVGAAIGPMLAGVVSAGGSWSYVFYMLVACDAMALVLLLRIAKSEINKYRMERRMHSPRLVRIE